MGKCCGISEIAKLTSIICIVIRDKVSLSENKAHSVLKTAVLLLNEHCTIS